MIKWYYILHFICQIEKLTFKGYNFFLLYQSSIQIDLICCKVHRCVKNHSLLRSNPKHNATSLIMKFERNNKIISITESKELCRSIQYNGESSGVTVDEKYMKNNNQLEKDIFIGVLQRKKKHYNLSGIHSQSTSLGIQIISNEKASK